MQSPIDLFESLRGIITTSPQHLMDRAKTAWKDGAFRVDHQIPLMEVAIGLALSGQLDEAGEALSLLVRSQGAGVFARPDILKTFYAFIDSGHHKIVADYLWHWVSGDINAPIEDQPNAHPDTSPRKITQALAKEQLAEVTRGLSDERRSAEWYGIIHELLIKPETSERAIEIFEEICIESPVDVALAMQLEIIIKDLVRLERYETANNVLDLLITKAPMSLKDNFMLDNINQVMNGFWDKDVKEKFEKSAQFKLKPVPQRKRNVSDAAKAAALVKRMKTTKKPATAQDRVHQTDIAERRARREAQNGVASSAPVMKAPSRASTGKQPPTRG
jgi:hypothetical protein